MYVIIVEWALKKAEVCGPFPHEEDADEYRKAHYKTNVCRIVKLVPPETG